MPVRDHETQLTVIAIDGTPKDSGNMAFNALQVRKVYRGLKYYWSIVIAPYVIPQNEGFIHWKSKEFIDKNKGFVDTIELRMIAYLTAKMSGLEVNINKSTERVKALSNDNPARQKTFLHSVRSVTR